MFAKLSQRLLVAFGQRSSYKVVRNANGWTIWQNGRHYATLVDGPNTDALIDLYRKTALIAPLIADHFLAGAIVGIVTQIAADKPLVIYAWNKRLPIP